MNIGHSQLEKWRTVHHTSAHKNLSIVITPCCIGFIFTTVLNFDQFYSTPSLAPAEKNKYFQRTYRAECCNIEAYAGVIKKWRSRKERSRPLYVLLEKGLKPKHDHIPYSKCQSCAVTSRRGVASNGAIYCQQHSGSRLNVLCNIGSI